MIVINGQVNAPAEAALTTSTPRRIPKSLLFHVESAAEDTMVGTAVPDTLDSVVERSEPFITGKEASCATASRVILIWRRRDRSDS